MDSLDSSGSSGSSGSFDWSRSCAACDISLPFQDPVSFDSFDPSEPPAQEPPDPFLAAIDACQASAAAAQPDPLPQQQQPEPRRQPPPEAASAEAAPARRAQKPKPKPLAPSAPPSLAALREADRLRRARDPVCRPARGMLASVGAAPAGTMAELPNRRGAINRTPVLLQIDWSDPLLRPLAVTSRERRLAQQQQPPQQPLHALIFPPSLPPSPSAPSLAQ